MVKLDIVQMLALGAGIGAGYQLGRVYPSTATVAKGAAIGALAAGVLSLLLREPEVVAAAAAAPPSPVVTRGAFAGLPRPLYNTSDAARHHHEETGT